MKLQAKNKLAGARAGPTPGFIPRNGASVSAQLGTGELTMRQPAPPLIGVAQSFTSTILMSKISGEFGGTSLPEPFSP